jgi:O-antigen/teichoic acid export membrane protein
MTGIAALTTILTQLDKVILSKMLTLESFGYYTLVFSLASILSQLVTPVSSALFPKFSQIVAGGERTELGSLIFIPYFVN